MSTRKKPTVFLLLFLIGIGLYLAWLLFVTITGPAWMIFLDIRSLWTCFGIIVGFGMLGIINIPSFFIRKGGNHLYFNGAGFLLPIALLYYTGQSLNLEIPPMFIALFFFNWVVLHVGSFSTPKGIFFYSIVLQSLAFINSIAIIKVLGTTANPVLLMWWVFCLMFSSTLLVDLYRALINLDKFKVPKGKNLAIGGAGMADALMSAPVSGLVYTYCLLQFWYDIHLSV